MFVQDNQESGSQHMLRGTLQDQSHLSAWPSSGTRVSRTAATSTPVVNTGTTSWFGNSFSRLRRRGTRNPASVTAEAAVALSRYRTAIPAPEPVPVIRAKTGTSAPPGRIAGSNTLSARGPASSMATVSYTHLRAHETRHDLVCRLLLEKKKKKKTKTRRHNTS